MKFPVLPTILTKEQAEGLLKTQRAVPKIVWGIFFILLFTTIVLLYIGVRDIHSGTTVISPVFMMGVSDFLLSIAAAYIARETTRVSRKRVEELANFLESF